MPSFQNMGDVFIAPTALAIRQYMRSALRGGLEHYDRVVLPMVGRFQIAECAIDAGWRAGEIQCADTNLFSAVLGYMAAGKDIAELAITFPGDTPEAEWARTKFANGSHAAAVFLLIKLAQFKRTVTMERLVRESLWDNRDHYGNQFQANAMRLAEKLRGLDYHVADVHGIADEAAMDERALIYLDPGKTAGNVFACVGEPGHSTASITWNAPVIAPFDPKNGMDKLHHDLMPAHALALFHWHGRGIPEVYRERSVYVVERGPDMREHVLCNRPDEARRLVKPRVETEISAATIPVFAGALMADTKVTMVPASKAQALYYADLWGHKVPGRIGQCFFILLDGCIAGVVGMNFADIRMSKGPWVTLAWCAQPPYPDDPLDIDLLLWILCCEDSRKLFEIAARAPLYDPSVLKVRADRATPDCPVLSTVLELKTRERREDGTFALTYEGSFHGANWDSCIAKWLDKLRK